MASDNRTRQDTIEESAAASESPGERGAVVDSLAGGAIHELNNILGVILGNVELASMDSTLSESVRTSLDEIGKAGRDGLRLMREILALSRRKPLSSDLADWKPVVDDIACAIEPGPTTMAGMSAMLTNNPASVPNDTFAWLLRPASFFASVTSA